MQVKIWELKTVNNKFGWKPGIENCQPSGTFEPSPALCMTNSGSLMPMFPSSRSVCHMPYRISRTYVFILVNVVSKHHVALSVALNDEGALDRLYVHQLVHAYLSLGEFEMLWLMLGRWLNVRTMNLWREAKFLNHALTLDIKKEAIKVSNKIYTDIVKFINTLIWNEFKWKMTNSDFDFFSLSQLFWLSVLTINAFL